MIRSNDTLGHGYCFDLIEDGGTAADLSTIQSVPRFPQPVTRGTSGPSVRQLHTMITKVLTAR